MKQDVPNIIHYCWFGYGELSDTAKRVLLSWEKYAPGYEIRCCDENVFDINTCEWTRKAYEAKKYAFVADYARFRMIYDYGGIYMDLGSKLIKDIVSLVDEYRLFSAIEEQSKTVNAGLIMVAPPGDPLVADVLARYESMEFKDDPEFLATNTVNEIFTSEFEKRGFLREDRLQRVSNWVLLPSSAFNPAYGFGEYHIKKDTYSIHHYSGSWTEPAIQIKKKIVTAWTPFVGRRAAQILGRIIGEFKVNGVPRAFSNLIGVAKCNLSRTKK